MLIDAIIDKYGNKEGLTVRGGKIESWPYAEKKPTITAAKLIEAEYKTKKELNDKITKIKEDAKKAILEIAPEWKQRNLLAALIIDPSHQEAIDTFAAINSIREESDLLEQEVRSA